MSCHKSLQRVMVTRFLELWQFVVASCGKSL